MIIRTMKAGDEIALAQIETQCFSDPWSANAFIYELTNSLSDWLVAEDHGQIVGYVGSQSVLDEADMMNLAILPEYRRQGLACLLVDKLIEILSDRGVVSLSLEVRVSNTPAICLYKKLGFYQVGKRAGYYRNPREDAYIMRREW